MGSQIERLENLTKGKSKLLAEIIRESTATGSRVYGGSTDESDFDFIVPPNSQGKFWDLLRMNEYTLGEYKGLDCRSYYITDGNYTLNFIVPRSESSGRRWMYANNMMKKDYDNGIIYYRKDARIRKFEFYKELFCK